ncbi:hypothetical protein [Neisseria sp. Ec49-e6-T10]|uniref:hypothetical protein n=1 Tax=Neisseria sp. Ec49-e6-T10 TaxID=3140744 RepID=UPI003EB951C6
MNMKQVSLLLLSTMILSACVTTDPFAQNNTPKKTSPIEPKKERTLPNRTEEPTYNITLKGQPEAANTCLRQAILSTFRIPEEFLQSESFPRGDYNISLINPATGSTGVSIDLHKKDGSTDAKMYANGTTVSKAWSKILHQCE